MKFKDLMEECTIVAYKICLETIFLWLVKEFSKVMASEIKPALQNWII